MKKKQKNFRKFKIQLPNGTQSITLEKDQKQYHPIVMTTSNPQNLDKNQYSEDTVKLEHNPITKKRVKQLSWYESFWVLVKFPWYIEDPQAGAKMVLLVFLSQLLHLLLGLVPMMPAICLDSAPSMVLNIIGTLLSTIQGPEQWNGKGWWLRRPWIICPRLSLCETAPSAVLADYIGGKFKDHNKKKRIFCYPYVDSSMVLAPGLPANIAKTLISISPLSLPIVFGHKEIVKNRAILELRADSFVSYNVAEIENMKTYMQDCYLEITIFLQWFCKKKKRVERWKDDMDRFRPFTRQGSFTRPRSDELTECLCAALALFRQYLIYASEKVGWITQKEAEEIMLRYWRLVMPESAPCEEDDKTECLSYKAPETFYQFLTEYFLPTYHNQVLCATKGTMEVMGLVRDMDGTDLFIAPRKKLLEVYAQWLDSHHASSFDLSASKGEATVQRELLESGVPLKGEKGNPSTWRYSFYGKEHGIINCIALPIKQLPEQVQATFETLFGLSTGSTAHPNLSERDPNSSEGGKAL